VKYTKYHALGNDYLVIPFSELENGLEKRRIKLICHRNYGVGSDGILIGPLRSETCDFGLRIFNPDGSEAEKSGNGLRIFARYLWDEGLIKTQPFTVETLGGSVSCEVALDGKNVIVEMGSVSFDSTKIPVAGSPREVLKERMEIGDRIFEYCAATIGNPHCVVLCEKLTPGIARSYGPIIEMDSRFPNRTNVQFMEIIDHKNIRIEIWERGAGYTLASGSSSTAAAAVAHKLGFCGSNVIVHMPGGDIAVSFLPDFTATIEGPVVRVCSGAIDKEMFINDAFEPQFTLDRG
jgi:diaminopimelate epimerase